MAGCALLVNNLLELILAERARDIKCGLIISIIKQFLETNHDHQILLLLFFVVLHHADEGGRRRGRARGER